jgi:hypothetical protein
LIRQGELCRIDPATELPFELPRHGGGQMLRATVGMGGYRGTSSLLPWSSSACGGAGDSAVRRPLAGSLLIPRSMRRA